MADTITMVIILFIILNFVGILFFGGRYDSKISTVGTTSTLPYSSVSANSNLASINNGLYNNGYQMSGVNTTSVYNSISPTIQQVKTNIVTKLDQQKARIREHEQQLEARRQDLINKQHQLQTEIDKLDDTIQTSLSEEQIAQINQIKSNLKNKINSIQTQLHGVDAGKVHCVLPTSPTNSFNVIENTYEVDDYSASRRGASGRRSSRTSRRQTRRPQGQDWARDWSLDDEFTRQPTLEEDITIEGETDINECFSDSNPFVNVFSGSNPSTFSPF